MYKNYNISYGLKGQGGATQANARTKPEPVPVKDYEILWNTPADSDGLRRIKTKFTCEDAMFEPMLRTLPKGEYELICLTDLREEVAKQKRLKYLQSEMDRLNGIPQTGEQDEILDQYADEVDDFFEEAHNPTSRDVYQRVTYYGRVDSDIDFYDKEEIHRFSSRVLKLNGLTE